jgi:hypothetical protein
MKPLGLLIAVFLVSCQVRERKISTIRRGDFLFKGKIQHDSIFNDTIFVYDLNEKLVSKRNYRNNELEGISIVYYNNGSPKTISAYSHGLKNGYQYFYDSTGKKIYQDFYYCNLAAGPIIYFNKNGDPDKYFFISLDNKTLLHFDYSNWDGVKSIVNECINYTINLQQRNLNKEMSIFIYLINPPKFSFQYLLYKKKMNSENFFELMNIDGETFKEISVPILPEDETYVIGLRIYDSVLNKQTIVYKDVF